MYAWNQLGRRVKKGEKGIRILAPVIGLRRKKDGEAAISKDPAAINKPMRRAHNAQSKCCRYPHTSFRSRARCSSTLGLQFEISERLFRACRRP